MRMKRSRETPADLALPAFVDDEIAEATFMLRPPGENGEPRVLCQFQGRTGFIFREETAAAAIAGLFPELNEHQMGQGVRRLYNRARLYLRSLEMPSAAAYTPWKDRY